MLFGTWLRSVRARQQDDGLDHRELATYASKLTPYVRDELSTALHKLESVYIRIPPEVLGDAVQRERWLDLREEYIREIRIALDHIAATLTVVGCTDAELSDVLDDDDEEEEVDNEDVEEDGNDEEEFVNDVTVQIPVPLSVGVGTAEDDK